MAPLVKPTDPSIERTTEYEEFIAKLAAYHEKRGTYLDREPKLNNRHLDLLRLYKRVLEEGGYDRASDTKGNALAWRRIAAEFFPPNTPIATLAFQVKTAYYKNLAAYEISTHHGKEPPPKEILEDLTAKGGDLLNRTIENYAPKLTREQQNLINGGDSGEGSDSEQKTPRDDKMDIDELGNTPGRVTRGLRHAPPPRVLFQPDGSGPRQTRSGQPNAAAPGHALTNGTTPITLTNYEPKPPLPSAVRPVATPANNPELFNNLRKKWMANRNARRGILPTRGMMLPGTGFAGPNIYIRAMLALQSDVQGEIAYALHHLVKISHERGDKYRFDGFPGLAEALILRVLKVSSLFYDVEWDVQYGDEDYLHRPEVLNGTNGTKNLLEKIESLPPREFTDDMQSDDFSQHLNNIHEAALVLRNMVMLEENAVYVSNLPLIRDLITIVLKLPRHSIVAELQHYILEIAEQLTKGFRLGIDDPMYHALLSQLASSDRGMIITSLRALARIAINFEDWRNSLQGVPLSTLRSICSWLLVEDEELRNACLDFLYQFTAVTENVELLLQNMGLDDLVEQLVRLLMFNATTRTEYRPFNTSKVSRPAPPRPPKLGPAIVDQLVQIPDAREQSSQWLRTCFEEDPDGEVTQIALWQAYTATFENVLSKNQLQPAKDFITNVSATFPGANAQVVGQPPNTRYTIRGVRYREEPVDRHGRPYVKCRWQTDRASTNGDSMQVESECGESFPNAKTAWDHIIVAHLGIMKDGNESFKVDPDPTRRYDCRWAGCSHFKRTRESPSAYVVGSHVQTHLPDTSAKASSRQKHNHAPQELETARHEIMRKWLNTQEDENHHAAGLPLASVLVLRNLARQLSKLERQSDSKAAQDMRAAMGGGGHGKTEQETLVAKVFRPVNEKLCFVGAHNWPLREYIGQVTKLINAGGGWL